MISTGDPEPARLVALMRDELPDAVDVYVAGVERMFGGNARRAWRFDTTWTDASGNDHQIAAVLLCRVEPGQLESDPNVEFRVLRGLAGYSVPAPHALALDTAGEVLGAPAIALERIQGSADVRGFLQPADPESSRRLTVELARAATCLHRVDPDRAGLFTTGHSAGCAVVEYWADRFRTDRLEPHPVLSAVFDWLIANVPTPTRECVVHGDLRPGNFLVDDGHLTTLLDWEMAHRGDPAEDIAWIYRPMWSPAPFVSLPEFVETYNEVGDVEVSLDAVRYWRIFAEAKFATISLGAARVFHDGLSNNLRLADRAAMVTPCLKQALTWMREVERAPANT